jgi:Protein of unknown function (DUF3263)
MTPSTPRTASEPVVARPRTATADIDAGAEVDGDLLAGDRPGVAAPIGTRDGEPFEDELDTDVEAAAEPVAAVAADPAAALTERERLILDFERQWWRHAGAKEQAIRDRFAISSTRYYQAVNALLDNPAALAYDPVLVRRLRRLRATRARARTGGRRIA